MRIHVPTGAFPFRVGVRPLAALAAALALGSCAGDPPAPPLAESLLIVTVDTWRADALGAAGSPEVRTPALDRFFRRNVHFAEAYSPSPTTLASHTSLMTGAWPTTHGVPANIWAVPEDVVTLAEILSEEGFATAAFVSSGVLAEDFNLDQGFDRYNFKATAVANGLARDDGPWRPAYRTLHRAATWWKQTSGPRFLWAHVWEAHFPYEAVQSLVEAQDPGYSGAADGSMRTLRGYWDEAPPSERDRRHTIALYHAELAGLDRWLGRFLDEIDLDGTIVVLTSDHGESLGEHGLHFKHGPNVFPSDLQVPLALRVPGMTARVNLAQVRTLDVPRTVLAVLGQNDSELPPESVDILSRADGSAGLPVFAVATQPWREMYEDVFPGTSLQRALRLPDAAVVETPYEETVAWFDRTIDPSELAPRSILSGSRADSMRSALSEWIGTAEFRPGYEPIGQKELREQLRSLGYVE